MVAFIICALLQRLIDSSQSGSKWSSRSRLSPSPVPKIRMIRRILDAVTLELMATLYFFFVNKMTMSISSNVQTSSYGSLDGFQLSTCVFLGKIRSSSFLLSDGRRSASIVSGGDSSSPVYTVV